MNRMMGAQLSALNRRVPRLLEIHSKDQWKAHFNSCKEANKLLVVEFTDAWCKPCKFIEPVITEFSCKYSDVAFVKIDVDDLQDVAGEFVVDTMPTFALVKKGREVDRVAGTRTDELQKKIEKHRK